METKINTIHEDESVFLNFTDEGLTEIVVGLNVAYFSKEEAVKLANTILNNYYSDYEKETD